MAIIKPCLNMLISFDLKKRNLTHPLISVLFFLSVTEPITISELQLKHIHKKHKRISIFFSSYLNAVNQLKVVAFSQCRY